MSVDLVDTITAHTREVIEYVVKHHSQHSQGELRAIYNGLELRVDITYQGSPMARVPALRHAHTPVPGELEDEEAAAYVGLRNFLQSLCVGRQQIKAKKTSVVVHLFYAV